jgi:hypothetical protein
MESLLERCPTCREMLAAAAAGEPGVADLVERVRADLDVAVAAAGKPHPRRSRVPRWLVPRWLVPNSLSWLVATGAVLLVAVVLELIVGRVSGRPSAALLLAPLAPLLGVAASFGRNIDPAYEIVAPTVRGGLALLLRRTAVVLAVALPALAMVGWVGHTSPALWLLPCLAFTAATLALGGVFGVARAAIVLATIWTVLVAVPAWAAPRASAAWVGPLLDQANAPLWALLTALGVAVVLARPPAYARLGATR